MPLNNNQKMIQGVDSAAARMARLPVVRSAWSKLSVLYTNTKCSRPDLRYICDALEDRAVNLCTRATHTISPVIVILEPQISMANDIASRSLDWLESAFPLLQAPTEEIVAAAKDKMHEAKEMLSVIATGTKGRIQHTVEQAMNTVLHTDGHSSPFIERAVTVAGAGLDHALNLSEALVDCMVPSAGEEPEDSVERLDATPRRTYPERLQYVSTKLYKGSYKAIETLSPSWARGLPKCLSSFISRLPLYLQNQTATLILFMLQMYTLSCPSPQQTDTENSPSTLSTGVSPSRKDWLTVVKWQESPTWRVRLRTSTDCDCKEL
ncbi:hypothetical protein NL108_009898 [Boleophthalmus pectinirostris]|uniref:perilipin-2-like n=1 Tax=Boleophthalmus pectinirostris TaxID=150288 RepID=UPI00242F1C13|nr:perilipin-2-like [Boleophthalmus pectinirostris]KAJ0041641.1 hypothetical protein NL108_009898 [Boleophthalmus pectinirostris]